MVQEKIDWFCPKCNSYVSSESVTFEETHQICNTGVILKELNQNKMETILIIEAKMTDEQLEVLVSEIKKISEIIGIKLTFKSE